MPFDNRDTDFFIQRFKEVASTGIQLCIYISACYENAIAPIVEEYPNVKIMQFIEAKDIPVFQFCEELEEFEDLTLPEKRNEKKDTKEYMLLMHAKLDFINDTIQKNPWHSTHFAWIDFGISYIFRDKENALHGLKNISQYDFPKQEFLFIPGCWEKLLPNQIPFLFNEIHWRFCGGFFLGDKKSMSEFYQLYRTFFPIFIKEYKKIVWEVNFWTWLECTQNWNPIWFMADHNDTMIQLPFYYSVQRLFDFCNSIVEYNYPTIPQFLPDSASYLFHKGKHLLNTRYINYEIQSNGYYLFKTGKHVIESLNLYSELDSNFKPKSYNWMKDYTIYLSSYPDTFSTGLEDIRLFEYKKEVWFLATSVNYSPSGRNRMIMGKYNIENYTYNDSIVIEPPYNTRCEKNWIPIVQGEELYFVYKWYPFEIGKIDTENNNTLKIVKIISNLPLIFMKVRGSTPFLPDPEENGNLVGMVHFSEETSPRRYYNFLVLLDKDTLAPLKYTEVFYFQKQSIEFCVGMTIVENQYKFWISRMDRDPALVTISKNKIPFTKTI
jgi:hypothetical protein